MGINSKKREAGPPVNAVTHCSPNNRRQQEKLEADCRTAERLLVGCQSGRGATAEERSCWFVASTRGFPTSIPQHFSCFLSFATPKHLYYVKLCPRNKIHGNATYPHIQTSSAWFALHPSLPAPGYRDTDWDSVPAINNLVLAASTHFNFLHLFLEQVALKSWFRAETVALFEFTYAEKKHVLCKSNKNIVF